MGSLADYEEIRQLGSGLYGDIYLCNRRSDNEIVCVKHVDVTHLSQEQRDGCWNEVRISEELHHPNIIAHHGAFLDESPDCGAILGIVMEYCDGGDLAEWLYRHHQSLDEATVLPIFVQIAMALHHIHRSQVLHRDMKPKNIFLFENGRVVVGDFGISKCLDPSKGGLAQTLVGSPAYMCPEIFEGKLYGLKADIWSLGCILYEMLTGKCPFRASSYPSLVQKITTCSYDPLPITLRPCLRQMVSSMLSLSPNDRPTMDEILLLPFLQRHIQHYLAHGHELCPVSSQAAARQILQDQYDSLHPPIDPTSPRALVRPSAEIAASSPEDIKAFVKSKMIASVSDASLDSKAIVQLRALQAAQKYKQRSATKKTSLNLPLCDIHVQQFARDVAPTALTHINFQPTPPVFKPRQSKKFVPDDMAPKSPRHRPKTIRGVSPPPPPVVGVRPAVPSSPFVLDLSPNQLEMEVVGIQIKSTSKRHYQ
ncbi:hypothetical protein Ae201684_000821 [Aphanomyces euteiches]|uniref:non-specific serine/threonine protein kinase n=1 Tax=Aphanomyces euteiches TaxID=100861 RepID=A0A6G0XUI8_9STRA|nr:hypothetical protein Ae201684_000821 [Aphanomyces euteiches]